MIKLETTAPNVWANYENEHLICGSKVYLPDTANLNDWQEFDSEADAKAFFGIVAPLTNAQMLEGLGIQPNEEGL